MIRFLAIGFAILAVLWLLLRFLGSNFCGRGRSRIDFAHGIRSLLLMMENTGFLRIRHRPSTVYLDVIRASGSDRDAELLLIVPRREWSQRSESALKVLFESHDLDAHFDHSLDSEILARVSICIPDIWAEASAASAARAACLVVDTLSIPHDAEFDLGLHGERSNRIAEREKARRASGSL